MSHQTTLTKYFKSKHLPVQIKSMSRDMNKKRHSLSLKKTPTSNKSPKLKETSDEVIVMEKQEDIIDLSSDSEHGQTPRKRQNLGLINNDEHLSTIEAAPEKLQSPDVFLKALNSCPTTNFVYNLSPSVVLQSPKTPTKTCSPGSSKKFYSPTKKRILKKKSSVKRNLENQFTNNIALESSFDDNDQNSTLYDKDKDDKTIFLLSIIHKYLKTDSLKHLLEEDSQVLLEKCTCVVKPGMRLMCRLYWRQQGWYRMEDLGQITSGKKEVLSSSDLINMITCLVEYGLITPAGCEGETKMDFDDYVKLLKKPDLHQICKELKLKIQSKQDAVEALRSFSKLAPISNFYTKSNKINNNRTRVLEILKSRTGSCYKMSDIARTTFYNLYVLMYLGIDYTVIRDKQLEWVLINHKIKRETYPIDKEMVVDDASVIFLNRQEFYRYLQAHMTYENYLKETDAGKKCEIVKQSFNMYKGVEEEHMLRFKSFSVWLRRFTPPHIYIKILESGVQELKKLKTEENYKLAVDILDTLIGQVAFRQHKKAIWYAEKALILHSHLESSEKAAQVLLEGLKSNLAEETKDAMRPRAMIIANQKNIDLKEELRDELRKHADKDTILENKLPADHIYKQPMDNYNQRGKLKFVEYTAQGRITMTAEDYCVFHYVSNGEFTHGEHWEGRIVTTIFFLLFWDIIYIKPPCITGIFMSHYQRYPLDMFSESFYINRKALIDDRLKFIEESSDDRLMTFMESKWNERPEYEISDIQRSAGWDSVRAVAQCARPRGLAALCRRLALNYGYARSGFPDLTLWNEATRKIKFVEVKTDADKPSVKQLQWIQYLIENGIDAGFCYVGVNTTRSRARPSANGAP